MKVIKYPPFIDIVAIFLGKFRDILNTEMNERNPEFKRGDKSESVNIVGITGELIFQYHLWSTGVQFKATDLLSSRPLAEPDVIIDKTNIDVKTVRSDAKHLLVNKKSHLKNKGVNHYCFIQTVSSGVAYMWYFSHAEVSNWEVGHFGYSLAYSRELKELVPEA